jgi:hypothetical protein
MAGIRSTNVEQLNIVDMSTKHEAMTVSPNGQQTEVMPRYYYQDGSEVKENDIVFYSEDGGNHAFHYADSIGVIVKRQNDIKMKAYVITMDDAKTFQYYEEPENNMVSLKKRILALFHN